tara:strand:+ start:79 stop:642 length:564 start_codon:yes stop_codon:yes gene_type:complete
MSKGNANKNGLQFERDTFLIEAITNINLFDVNQGRRSSKVCEGEIYYKNSSERIARVVNGWGFYKDFLETECDIKTKRGFSVDNILSKNLEPDEALINYVSNHVYIIEKKYQGSQGSVDEKLQTCHFKFQQYNKLIKETKFELSYFYLLDTFYNDKKYTDVFTYIRENDCDYFFQEIPLEKVGLYAK